MQFFDKIWQADSKMHNEEQRDIAFLNVKRWCKSKEKLQKNI